MKLCLKCKKLKELNEFNKDKSKKDGLQKWCRSCQKKYYENKRERILAVKKIWANSERGARIKRKNTDKYQKTKKGKLNKKKNDLVWRKRYPVKYKAVTALNNAIANGKIIKPTSCSICGKTNCRIDGHHHDYSKPLEIVWCCPQCHWDIHRKLLIKNNKND